MDGMNIQWYPGHMTKTRRMIAQQLRHMDAVCEILDARIPIASRNPDMEELTADKPRLIVSRRKTAKTEDRPGVTRTKQWVPVDQSMEVMDTPGMLWPKFEDPRVGFCLACTGAVRDEVMDLEELASRLIAYLGRRYPQALAERYRIQPEPEESGYDLLTRAGRKRGFVVRGGETDTERMARVLLDEFRDGRLGRFTLELPEELDHE